MDALKGLGEIGMGSRLKRVSEYMMKETQLVYNQFNINFDSYLFPAFQVIKNKNKQGVTNTELTKSLAISQPATTQAINKLLKKELILIKEDKLDKRKKVIFLSNKGKELIKNVSPIWDSIECVVKEYTSTCSNTLLEHINILEEKFIRKSFSTSIIEHIEMNTTKTNVLEIVDFKKEYSSHFYNLNIEWLKTYFYVEPYDQEVLSKPDIYIINKGGYVFFARLETKIVGTFALMPTAEDDVFELTKMAVSPKYRGREIGQKLMVKCLDFANTNNLKKIILYSNTSLENAIYIYRKYGFIEVPIEENAPYKRSDIKMELKINRSYDEK